MSGPKISKEVRRVITDPWEFIERLYIADKNGKVIKLKLNNAQRQVIQYLLDGYSLVIFKARQLGMSTAIRAYQFWKAYSSRNPFSAACVSHTELSAKEMTLKDKRFLEHLPQKLHRKLGKDSATSIMFMDTGARLTSYTAGGEGGLRSLSVNSLHLSEYDFYRDPEEVLATAVAAVNEGQIVIESTARFYGGPMWRLMNRIKEGGLAGKWKIIFLPWFEHEEYKSEVDDSFSMTSEEREISARYNLSHHQLMFRREKIAAMGKQKFRVEYPACPEDVFGTKDNNYYADEDLEDLTVEEYVHSDTNPHKFYLNPEPTDSYAIGVDVGAGIGRDYSFAAVLSKRSGRVVAVLRTNTLAPHIFSQQLQHLSIKYNNALTLIEENAYGLTVLEYMRATNFSNLWHDKAGKNWSTNAKTKILLHEKLKQAIQKRELRSIDAVTYEDLKSLIVEDPSLAPVSARNSNGHGDGVIAYGLAIIALEDVELNEPTSYQVPRQNIIELFTQEPINTRRAFSRGF